jgi:hypothetical protein
VNSYHPTFLFPAHYPRPSTVERRHRASRNHFNQLQSITEVEFMANLMGLATIVSELRVERTNLANQLRHVDAALSVLGKLDGGSSYIMANRPTRVISAASRRKMARAQKARWAKARNGPQPAKAVTGSAPAQRTMSASTRRKIAAAQRARWAKVKQKKKKKAT